MEWPGRGEHWLVRIIELVLDVPRMPATRHYREVRCQGSGLGGTSTGSSASSSWCSTFPGTQRCQGASHTTIPRGTVSREWRGRDEDWLVRVIEAVLDGPRGLTTPG